MTDIPKTYSPHDIEEKWYKYWRDKDYFHATDTSDKPPYSIVIPPPNITGEFTYRARTQQYIARHADSLAADAGLQYALDAGDRPCGYWHRNHYGKTARRLGNRS